MQPTAQDIQQMVSALFELVGGLNRAQRRNLPANRLAILHVVNAYRRVRPSVLAEVLHVNQSSVTRHMKVLEAEGAITVTADPEDSRACVLSLTDTGLRQLHALNRIGLKRFSTFVADWDAEEVRTFTRLLRKLEQSKQEAAGREKQTIKTRWRRKELNR